jgi:hypothetical protein
MGCFCRPVGPPQVPVGNAARDPISLALEPPGIELAPVGHFLSPVARDRHYSRSPLKLITWKKSRKRRSAPFARRSVWTLIAIVSVVIVVGGAIVGYQIHQLQSDINVLNHQLTVLNQMISQKVK